MTRRPDIIYFHTHDTGRHIEPYGAPVRTPRLQEFAENGVVFRNAHAVAPTCSPSRAGLLTGRWAHSCGMLGLAHRGHRLVEPEHHLAHRLRRLGYTTTLIGVQHEAVGDGAAAGLGYDDELACRGNLATDRRSAVEEFLARDESGPSFLSIGLVETHILPVDGWTFAHPGTESRWNAPPPTLPDTAATRREMSSFVSALSEVDATLGLLIDRLRATGRLDRTIIVVTTDHGLPMPGMKGTLTGAGTGVMLMMRGPGLPAGVSIDHLVSHLDVVPTLYDLIDETAPDDLQGHSLLPALSGRAVREETFAEVNFHVSYEPQRAVRNARHSYLRRFNDRDRPTLPNVDDSGFKDAWVAAGWSRRPVACERLHDLVLDPLEQVNLIDDERYAAVAADLRQRLTAWMKQTDDPLLAGPVPHPEGFAPQDPDTVSPL